VALNEIGIERTTESINKTIIEYDIVTVSTRLTTLKDLIRLVNLRINEGWSPIGGITDSDRQFSQVIVKYG